MIVVNGEVILSFCEIKRLKQRLMGMKQRCYNPKDKDYRYYGARGIKICKSWLNDTSAFIKWSIQNGGVDEDVTIDRIDPDGDYQPSNCRFLSRFENCVLTMRDYTGYDSPNLRVYRRYGELYENQFEKRHFGDVSWHFCSKRRLDGFTLYESLNIPYKQTRAKFWNNIRKGKIKFHGEVFLYRQDKEAIWFAKKDSVVECIKCKNSSLRLNFKELVSVVCDECGFNYALQSK